MTLWEPKNGEFLETRCEPENELDKYAVAVIKNSVVVRHLAKGKTGRFARTISFFLRVSNDNSCKVEVTGKRVNLGDGHGLQIPCNLSFTRNFTAIDAMKMCLYFPTRVRINEQDLA